MDKKITLLSPAGNLEILKTAVKAGADSVYFAGKDFSARKNADNFSLEEIEEAVDYCKLRDVKTLLTVNTIYKNHELSNLLDFLYKTYSMGVDAYIIQDFAVLNLVKKYLPKANLHASTQMTAHSLEDVLFLEDLGFEKVVLARELSLKEIIYIKENSKCKLESFVHGALCLSYSGECMMSFALGGRSANRGECAQACRLKYDLYKEDEKIDEGHLLSPKDLESLSIIKDIIDAKIDSIKIEGRMKNKEYVYMVTTLYRKYIDSYLESGQALVAESDYKKLLQVFNRGGFTQGYFKNYASKDMISKKSPRNQGVYIGKIIEKNNNSILFNSNCDLNKSDVLEINYNDKFEKIFIQKDIKKGSNIWLESNATINSKVYKIYDKALSDEINQDIHDKKKQVDIDVFLLLKVNKKAEINIKYKHFNIHLESDFLLEKAEKQALSLDRIKEQILKTSDTAFNIKNLEIVLDDEIFIPISKLNKLRRNALSELENEIIKSSKRTCEHKKYIEYKPDRSVKNAKLSVLIKNKEQFLEINKFNIEKIYIEYTKENLSNLDFYLNNKNNSKIFIALKNIDKENDYEDLEKSLVDGYLLRTLGQYHKLKNSKKELTSDINFNISNNEAIDFWDKRLSSISLSPELKFNEIENLKSASKELLIYGHLKLMKTQLCPLRDSESNKKFCKNRYSNDKYYLKDRYSYYFYINRDCENCIAYIMNNRTIYILDELRKDKVDLSLIDYFMLDLSSEPLKELKQILITHEDFLMYNDYTKLNEFSKKMKKNSFINIYK